jgi:hypothetical protein
MNMNQEELIDTQRALIWAHYRDGRKMLVTAGHPWPPLLYTSEMPPFSSAWLRGGTADPGEPPNITTRQFQLKECAGDVLGPGDVRLHWWEYREV